MRSASLCGISYDSGGYERGGQCRQRYYVRFNHRHLPEPTKNDKLGQTVVAVLNEVSTRNPNRKALPAPAMWQC